MANTATGSWTLKAWQGGGASGYHPVTISDDILALLLPGDADGDGWVDNDDLSIILGNWGQTGLGRAAGDLDGSGTVDGADWTEVISYWNPEPTEPPEATPERAVRGCGSGRFDTFYPRFAPGFVDRAGDRGAGDVVFGARVDGLGRT